MSNSDAKGAYVSTRDGTATTISAYKDAATTLIGSLNDAVGTPPAVTVMLLAFNNVPMGGFATDRIAAAFIGGSLTSTGVRALNASINTFLTAAASLLRIWNVIIAPVRKSSGGGGGGTENWQILKIGGGSYMIKMDLSADGLTSFAQAMSHVYRARAGDVHSHFALRQRRGVVDEDADYVQHVLRCDYFPDVFLAKAHRAGDFDFVRVVGAADRDSADRRADGAGVDAVAVAGTGNE